MSRARSTSSSQSWSSPVRTKPTRAAKTNVLSAMGSSSSPSRVRAPVRRASHPSMPSLIPATSAIPLLTATESDRTNSAASGNLSNEMAFGQENRRGVRSAFVRSTPSHRLHFRGLRRLCLGARELAPRPRLAQVRRRRTIALERPLPQQLHQDRRRHREEHPDEAEEETADGQSEHHPHGVEPDRSADDARTEHHGVDDLHGREHDDYLEQRSQDAAAQER